MNRVLVEFYKTGTTTLIESLRVPMCPDVGEKINIRGESWLIVSRSWALDYTDMPMSEHQIRACLNCKPTTEKLSTTVRADKEGSKSSH